MLIRRRKAESIDRVRDHRSTRLAMKTVFRLRKHRRISALENLNNHSINVEQTKVGRSLDKDAIKEIRIDRKDDEVPPSTDSFSSEQTRPSSPRGLSNRHRLVIEISPFQSIVESEGRNLRTPMTTIVLWRTRKEVFHLPRDKENHLFEHLRIT